MSRTTRNTIIGWGLYLTLISVIAINAADPILIGANVMSVYVSQLIIFYLNYLVLAPKILEQKKVGRYLIIIVVALLLLAIASLFVQELIKANITPIITELDVDSYKFGPAFRSLITNTVAIIISNLIVKSNLLSQTKQEKLELKNKVLEAETMALKAQINPHFLFNALNNIYALSQTNPAKTGDAVLQLSHLLSYITYDGNKKLVKLAMEIDYIKHFVELQFLKDHDNSNITVQLPTKVPDLDIAPLLLIPFIENAFKHSNLFDKQLGWVNIHLIIEETTLFLNVSNSVGEKPQHKDKVGGIGLENVKKRLDLLYKGHYTLNIRSVNQMYDASLKIDLIS